MKLNTVWMLLAATLLVALLVGARTWYQTTERLDEMRLQILAAELRPIATLLKQNQALIKELQAESLTDKDAGILASYLAKIRKDGVAKHVDMKQRLEALAENNTAVVTLIKAYAPHASTAVFAPESDKFRNYASVWRDRWNSVMELFMAGGDYATSAVPFPTGFPAAVDGEIAAAK